MEKNYYPIEFDENGSSFVIVNNGTAPTPCCITIIPKIDIMNLVIEGLSREPIKVSNVKTKDVLVIDAENRVVSINDVSAFDHYDGWEFPKLQPGKNTVKITNGAQASVAIEYSARYI